MTHSPPRRFKAGDSLDDYCRPCKALRRHTVLATAGDGVVVRVICGYCESQHNYRGGPVAEARALKAARLAAAAAGPNAGQGSGAGGVTRGGIGATSRGVGAGPGAGTSTSSGVGAGPGAGTSSRVGAGPGADASSRVGAGTRPEIRSLTGNDPGASPGADAPGSRVETPSGGAPDRDHPLGQSLPRKGGSMPPVGSSSAIPIVTERERRYERMGSDDPQHEGVDIEMLLRRVIREEMGVGPAGLSDKWRDGEFVLRPGRPGLQEKSWPIETFFQKVISIRNKLRVLEQQVNAAELPSDQKLKLQSYITGCYGSLTSFNVLFSEEDDRFHGSGGAES